jgi:hypothetical protein
VHVVTIIAFLFLLLLRWLVLRRQHSNRRNAEYAPSAVILPASGSAPLLRRAFREELIAWLITGLQVVTLYGVALLIGWIWLRNFGPLRPLHEWFQ